MSDIWYAIQHDRHFDYAFYLNVTLDLLGQCFMRYLGYGLVLIASLLICSIGGGAFFIVLPKIAIPWYPWSLFNYSFGTLIM